ncbi:hypothetical protein [Salipiger marinus]|uniref:Uncharacterized protein n=1 Tax=Salipiger marinus TaxID=555512 RepID=A0A1G8PWB0_9RHOB|nr:hypothetical protein [Salipiger marinus]SDI96556.1 hypothetical protein SAMN04487993_1013148 [Salipiger marinus]
MTDPHYTMAMDALGFAAQILTPHAEQFSGLVRAEQSMHSYLHITDPTLYIRANRDDGLRQQVELAKAALAFILAVQKVKNELEAAAPQEGGAE